MKNFVDASRDTESESTLFSRNVIERIFEIRIWFFSKLVQTFELRRNSRCHRNKLWVLKNIEVLRIACRSFCNKFRVSVVEVEDVRKISCNCALDTAQSLLWKPIEGRELHTSPRFIVKGLWNDRHDGVLFNRHRIPYVWLSSGGRIASSGSNKHRSTSSMCNSAEILIQYLLLRWHSCELIQALAQLFSVFPVLWRGAGGRRG